MKVQLGIAWILLVAAHGVRAADFWGGTVDVTSDYISRGLSFTDHEPALQADIHYHSPKGWLAGLFASSVKFGRGIQATVELDAYLGYGVQLSDDWAAKVQAVHYAYPWESISRHYEYDELQGALAYRNLLFFTVAWSPDVTMVTSTAGYRANRTAISYEAAAHVPLRGALSAAAGIGYYDLNDVGGFGYWYWNAGLTYTLGTVGLDLTYVGASERANGIEYPGTAGDRLVFTASYHF